MTRKPVRYYAAYLRGKEWVEVLVTSIDQRTTQEVVTGVTYRTLKAMDEAIGTKNRTRVGS